MKEIQVRSLTSGKTLKLISNNNPSSGGEGTFYPVSDPPEEIKNGVKLFKRGIDKEKKLEYMASHPPKTEQPGFRLCWPTEIVEEVDGDRRKGFLMRQAFHGSKQLTVLTSDTPDDPVWKSVFDLKNPNAFLNRLKLCFNVARALRFLHQSGQYVVVDLKPENILITPQSDVSIVDCDSIQIADTQSVLFYGPLGTDDYKPPEAKSIKLGKDRVDQSWDNFSLAVIFYRILFQVHPYGAIFKIGNKEITSFPDLILNELFVHGDNKKYAPVIPPPHNKFHSLPEKLKSLFFQAFEGGNISPENRPGAYVWGLTFKSVIDEMVQSQQQTPTSPKPTNLHLRPMALPTNRPTQQQKQTYAPPTPPAKAKSSPAIKYIFWGTALISLLYFGGNYISPILNYIFGTTISGTIVGTNGTPISLDKIGFASSKNNSVTLAGSVADSKGNFTLPVLHDISEGIYRLKINDQKLYLVLEGTENSINIEGDITDMDDYAYEISGSKSSVEYKNFMKELKGGQVTEDEFDAFIETTPNSLTALLAALTTKHKKLDIHEKVLNRLKIQYPQSTYIKEYANYMNAISSTLSSQKSYTVQIPDVVCMDFSAAEFLIVSSNLEMGQIKKDRSVTDIKSAYIWKQVPKYAPHREVDGGTSIDIYLTASLPETCRPTSDGSSSLPDNNVSPGKYPHTSTQYLTEGDIEGYSSSELRIMRNEIFARHGYSFKTQDMIEYFNHQAWYRPLPKNDDEVEIFKNSFSEIEKYNVNLIKKIEDSRQ